MGSIDPVLISIGMAAFGAVVWTIRQEGRINGHDEKFIEREKLAEERHEAIIQRLMRIERKQDAVNESHKVH